MKGVLRSTFSQLSSVLLVLLLVNLIISFLFLRWLVVDPGASQFAEILYNQLQLLKIELHDLSITQAQEWIQQHFPATGYQVSQQVNHLPELPPLRFYKIIQQDLSYYTGHDLVIYLSQEGQARLWFKLSWMKGYWLGIPFRAYLQNVYSMLGIILTLTTLLSLLVGYLLTAYLLRPLKELGQLAKDLPTMGADLPQFPRRGPKEVQQVSLLIEQSARQMQKLVQDRELVMAGVSHDLRTPLARLRIAAEWMTDEGLRQDMVHDVEEMDAIIDDFLDYMRAGQRETEKDINIPAFFNDLVSDYQRQGYAIDLTLGKVEQFAFRPVAITRLLNNLIGNAFKHGHPPVQVEAYERHGQFQIWVKDCGAGVNESQLTTLVEPFKQGENARTKGGSGLGLAIAVRIAQTHQAEFIIKNRQQQKGLKAGIVFSFTA